MDAHSLLALGLLILGFGLISMRVQMSIVTPPMVFVAFGLAIGPDGLHLASIDGGATWVSQTSSTKSNLLGVNFTDASSGTAVGENGIILRTTNGGVTWDSMTTGTNNAL